ncbi:hypothetical protein CHY_0296 [Carboxydothermus hydrogenoformans Z-2901]|uniref:Uncharacterized protein n=1 Tax=Carboxydothermus hydrogenoformans (strain ATCC BAA-161 / DSM 6008 / Z-2901) TaxID=246194 RepID=Q3AFB7_CARHZ|nr:hypothetical protein CHY_0296 [Carboxydothermus hydrogenoformans Z-2901]
MASPRFGLEERIASISFYSYLVGLNMQHEKLEKK